MPNALLTGVSGLLAHQRLLELVGHNISNVNTTGYKTQRAIFSDLLYETIRPASSASEGDLGGTNPNQIGLGVKLAATDRKFGQGSLESTGEQFDLALSGGGFFVVSDGSSDFFTRAGMFTQDEAGFLVAPGGFRVKRFPGVGEPDGINPGFQVPGEDSIRVPLGTPVPGVQTTDATITGNLSANFTPALATLMSSTQPFNLPGGVNATGVTLLNSLASNQADYQAGDQITIDGIDVDGTPRLVTVNVDGTTTLQDLVDAINAGFTGLTASISNGNILYQSNATGASEFTINIQDEPGNIGGTNFTVHAAVPVIEGKDADRYPEEITVYDVQGGAHEITLTFDKLNDDTWRMTASMSPADGVVVNGAIDNILFNDNGSFRSSGDPNLLFQFNGISTPQEIRFSFEDQSGLSQLTHYKSGASLQRSQNGSAPGTLVSVNVEKDGRVQAISSNGRIFTIAQISVASFRNPKGLVAIGDSLFQTTLNSGEPEFGTAGTGKRGQVRGGQLESSNVDIAFEFTRLIVAQRGFAANARTITVSDEVLEELTNIIR